MLDYASARQLIYLPTYKWVLDNVDCVHSVILKISEQAQKQDIVFLDYNISTDVYDYSKPLSHAYLVKLYIEGRYPSGEKPIEMTLFD